MVAAFQGGELIHLYYDDAVRRIDEELNSMSFATINANTDDELTNCFFDKCGLELLDLDPERPPTTIADVDPDEFLRTAPRNRSAYVTVSLPLVPKSSNPTLLQLRSSTWMLSPNLNGQASYDGSTHTIELRVPMSQSAEKLALAKQSIERLNEETKRFNPNFRGRVLARVQSRRAAATEEAKTHREMFAQFQQGMEDLGITVKRKEGSVEPVAVEVKKTLRVLREAPPPQPGPREPVLDPESVKLIVGLIDRSGKSFEHAPEVYSKLGEEDLRTIIVGHLNAVFESNVASGETFSKTGKSDILLQLPKGPVFIAECLYWDGQERYSGKISQLFGYLTWRQTEGVMVTFSRNKGLTRVVEEASRAIQDHPSYHGGFTAQGSTYLLSNHEHPDDNRRHVHVHHLFFNLYNGS